jgi:hypothetical protein
MISMWNYGMHRVILLLKDVGELLWQDQQIMDWFEFFVRKNGLKDEQCVVLVSFRAYDRRLL